MNKIINQIKFIGGALSLIIMAILFSILYINQKGKTDSVVINISGKQRMLTQKISKDIFRLSTSNSSDTSGIVKNLKEFDNSLNDLIKGNSQRGIYKPPTEEIKEQLLLVQKQWLPFKERVESFVTYLPTIRAKKDFVFNNNFHLLNYSDDIVKTMVKLNVEGFYIDLAGKQRMLSQRMISYALLYLNETKPESYSNFVESFKEYDKTIKMFSSNIILNKEQTLKELIEKNLIFWEKYSTEANDLIQLQSKMNEINNYIYNTNTLILDSMDQTVSIYSIHSENQRALIEKIEYTLGIIALLIMFYSVFLTKNIEKLFARFLSHSKDLTEAVDVSQNDLNSVPKCEYNNELAQASTHLKSFITKIDMMIIDARKAIKMSKDITQELSNVGDMVQKELGEKHIDSSELEAFIDKSEDVAIQSIEDLQNSEKLLEKLHSNLLKLLEQEK
ncbi:MAG: type IV pili methyl-accepting chemotaxis transducer N-terminal domain-containing protein [Epsilonproteobacteria bacterium]|nr:type IV pili methyl-accepting chemotaxis transducer N-terminal domain-containing protein [Campylobacterota bacterium]